MVIVGEWQLGEDGITRPVILLDVLGSGGNLVSDYFLVDTGADRTVLSATLLKELQLLGNHAPPGVTLAGIGGASPHVMVTTLLELTRDDGGVAHVRGDFAAFTDPAATDLSILGRDVLDNFDVITSRRHNAVLLLAGNHRYQVVGA
jgi:Aspartyl protease